MKIKSTKVSFPFGKGLLIIMIRTFIVLFCTTVFSLTPNGLVSQNTKIKIDEDKTVTIDEVFKIIRSQTKKYMFIYPDDLFNDVPEIQLKKGSIRLDKLINQSLANTSLNAILTQNNTIIIRDVRTKQQLTISGKVTDQNGVPLANVFIVTKGRGPLNGTNTDENGNYTITVSYPENVLIFSHIGYATQEIVVGVRSTIDVVLYESIAELSQVVVMGTVSTGYQTRQKERATGSFAKADIKILKSRDGDLNVLNRLDGLIPGLAIRKGNNFQGQELVIRGQSSVLVGSEPLYVLDGILVPNFNNVNPEDIEDITILKDASAAAIWGARAANGVIVVATKKGKQGKLKVNFKTFINYQGKPDFDYSPVLNSQQYIQAAKEIFDSDLIQSNSFIAPHDQILLDQFNGVLTDGQANFKLDSLASINNLSQVEDIWYRNAYTTGHTASVSGGMDNYSFYGSLGYTDVVSNRVGTDNKIYRMNLNQDFDLGSRIKISLNSTVTNTTSSRKNIISIGNSFLPYQLFRDNNGDHIQMPFMFGWPESRRLSNQTLSGVNLDYSPLDEIDYGYDKSNNWNFNITGGLMVELIKGLSYSGTYGYIKSLGKSQTYTDIKTREKRKELLGMTVVPFGSTEPEFYLPNYGGTYRTGNNDQRYWTVRNQLIYSTRLRHEKDYFNIQLGQEANEQLNTSNSTTLLGYNELLESYALLDYESLSENIFGVLDGGVGSYNTPPYTSSETLTRFSSYFALASYMINDKYGIDASWRRDQSNLFGTDKSTQNKPVWSVGAKWILDKENFLKNSNWINNLAFRTTYGITGNSPGAGSASSYDILTVSTVGGGIGGGSNLAGEYLSVSSAANNKLSWESTRTINFGLDFSLFKRKVTGSVDYYSKNTEDLLGRDLLNPFTGFSSTLWNIGNVTNHGIEFNLNTQNISSTDGFSWFTNFVLSYNKNELVSYSNVNISDSPARRVDANYLIGHSLSTLFAYRYGGLNAEGIPQVEHADGTKSTSPDAATLDDVVYMGTYQPKVSGGLSNVFNYKGFTLTANMVYNLGHVMRNDVNPFYTGRLAGSATFGGNVHADFANRWKNPGDETSTDIPGYYTISGGGGLVPGVGGGNDRQMDYYLKGDVNVVSASYIKLRDVTLTYNLPDPILENIGIDNLSLSAQIGNFLLWAENDEGIDPEFHSFQQGIRTIPGSRHPFNLSLSVSF